MDDTKVLTQLELGRLTWVQPFQAPLTPSPGHLHMQAPEDSRDGYHHRPRTGSWRQSDSIKTHTLEQPRQHSLRLRNTLNLRLPGTRKLSEHLRPPTQHTVSVTCVHCVSCALRCGRRNHKSPLLPVTPTVLWWEKQWQHFKSLWLLQLKSVHFTSFWYISL